MPIFLRIDPFFFFSPKTIECSFLFLFLVEPGLDKQDREEGKTARKENNLETLEQELL